MVYLDYPDEQNENCLFQSLREQGIKAIFLADRILVFSPRPGRISLEMPVYLPRPRLDAMRYSSVFGEMAERLHDAIV